MGAAFPGHRDRAIMTRKRNIPPCPLALMDLGASLAQMKTADILSVFGISSSHELGIVFNRFWDLSMHFGLVKSLKSMELRLAALEKFDFKKKTLAVELECSKGKKLRHPMLNMYLFGKHNYLKVC